MRTTLDLDQELVTQALAATGSRTKTEVIELALRQLLEREARKQLKAMRGTMQVEEIPRR